MSGVDTAWQASTDNEIANLGFDIRDFQSFVRRVSENGNHRHDHKFSGMEVTHQKSVFRVMIRSLGYSGINQVTENIQVCSGIMGGLR
jgi:hypothetical protein